MLAQRLELICVFVLTADLYIRMKIPEGPGQRGAGVSSPAKLHSNDFTGAPAPAEANLVANRFCPSFCIVG